MPAGGSLRLNLVDMLTFLEACPSPGARAAGAGPRARAAPPSDQRPDEHRSWLADRDAAREEPGRPAQRRDVGVQELRQLQPGPPPCSGRAVELSPLGRPAGMAAARRSSGNGDAGTVRRVAHASVPGDSQFLAGRSAVSSPSHTQSRSSRRRVPHSVRSGTCSRSRPARLGRRLALLSGRRIARARVGRSRSPSQRVEGLGSWPSCPPGPSSGSCCSRSGAVSSCWPRGLQPPRLGRAACGGHCLGDYPVPGN
jgi:hypothetical protein